MIDPRARARQLAMHCPIIGYGRQREGASSWRARGACGSPGQLAPSPSSAHGSARRLQQAAAAESRMALF